ncbi:MAG TPA: acyl-CoA synthetase [Ktedonobacterales bacterium]
MLHSIAEAVQQHAQQRPERVALEFEGRAISYAELAAQAERFARALAAWSVGPGDRVALFLENCPEFVTAYLGTHLAGGIVVLVNTQYREVELRHIMTDAGVRLCVTDAAGAEELARLAPTGAEPQASEGGAPQASERTEPRASTGRPYASEMSQLETLVIVGDGAIRLPSPPRRRAAGGEDTPHPRRVAYADFLAGGEASAISTPALPELEAPAILAYTSGTTGRAKGALLSHRNLTANIAAVTSAWHWTDRDRLLLVLPLFHAHGLMVGLHGTLYTGASAVLRRHFDAAKVLDTLRDDPAISMFFGVPTMYARLLAEAERRASGDHQGGASRPLRLFVSGSAPLSAQVFADFERVFGQRILERYGMTETIMNLTNPYDGERRAGTVGGPFPGQEARVVGVASGEPGVYRTPLPPGAIGEIEVRGPNVFGGYWNRPDATAEAFSADGWFKTGDLGWVSEDGYFTITGRARELIISGGYNVYPREVEDVLAQHPAVAEVAVLGLPDADLGERVVAVVVPRAGQEPPAEDLIAYCRERLASYKKPRRVVFAAGLPRNALGKVQKHLLAARLQPES